MRLRNSTCIAFVVLTFSATVAASNNPFFGAKTSVTDSIHSFSWAIPQGWYADIDTGGTVIGYPLTISYKTYSVYGGVTDTFIDRGSMTRSTPRFSLGMSNGGAFSAALSQFATVPISIMIGWRTGFSHGGRRYAVPNYLHLTGDHEAPSSPPTTNILPSATAVALSPDRPPT